MLIMFAGSHCTEYTHTSNLSTSVRIQRLMAAQKMGGAENGASMPAYIIRGERPCGVRIRGAWFILAQPSVLCRRGVLVRYESLPLVFTGLVFLTDQFFTPPRSLLAMSLVPAGLASVPTPYPYPPSILTHPVSLPIKCPYPPSVLAMLSLLAGIQACVVFMLRRILKPARAV